jgi:hypothetical protein
MSGREYVPMRKVLPSAVIGLTLGLAGCTSGPATSSSRAPTEASLSAHTRSSTAKTEHLTFPKDSWFSQITAASNGLLVSGQSQSNPRAMPTCVAAAVELDPLRLGPTDQGTCNDPLLAGQTVGTVNTTLPGSNNATLAIAHLDAQTGQVLVGPVVMTYAYVSDTRPVMAYGPGLLWIYDVATTNGPEVMQVSASTGAVMDTVSIPTLYRPLLAANDNGLWIGNSDQGGECTGCGPPSVLYHVPPGGSAATVADADSTSVACWMVGDGDHLWVGVGADQACLIQTIRRFDGSGAQPVFAMADKSFDLFNVVGGEAEGLWTVVPYPPTTRIPQGPYREDVIRIDPDTGQETVAAALPPIALPVYYWNTAQLWAFWGGSLYLLQPPPQPTGDGYGALLRVEVAA